MDVDKLSEKEAAGRKADHVWKLVEPYTKELITRQFQHMLQKYRNGENDVKAELASICSLEDLQELITYRIRNGRSAREELKDANAKRESDQSYRNP